MNQTLIRAAELSMTSPELAATVSRTQRQRLIDEAVRLTDDQWHAATECPRWTVFDIVAHVAAAMQNAANPVLWVSDGIRGMLRNRRDAFLDAGNEIGIDRRRGHTVAQLVADYRSLIDAAVPPRLMRWVPVPVGGLPPRADVAYLVDVVLARDAWLHRYDIARATGGSVDPDPSTTEVVAQVIRDLARAWRGPDVVLDLTGPEGGTWLLGRNPQAPVTTLPAVEFLRHLSGRVVPVGLLAGVPNEVRPELASARVTF
jgi:uncharacterized protein (TIGR03083 family)